MSELEPEDLGYEEWATALREGRLLGQECQECGYTTTTPKAGCVRCGSFDLVTVQLPTRGTVYSESAVQVTPAGFDQEYQIALIELGDTQARLLARVEGTLEIGDSAEFVDTFEQEGMPAPVFGDPDQIDNSGDDVCN